MNCLLGLVLPFVGLPPLLPIALTTLALQHHCKSLQRISKPSIEGLSARLGWAFLDQELIGLL